MNGISYFIFFSIAHICASIEASSNQSSNVVFLHVLFRHGDRTTDSWYGFPNDINKNETYYPIGPGQLTKKGKKTAYNIGKYLRQRYKNFLPIQYTPQVLYARSTNFKRTKMTLQLVLASLFPPQSSDIFEENLNWQPIPYDYEAQPDILQIAPLHCVNYIIKYYEYLLSEEGQNILQKHKPFYDVLSKYVGMKISTPRDVAKVYFTFKSQYDWGLKLPHWTKEFFPVKLEKETALDYEFDTATPTLKKLSAGFLLKKILDDTAAKIYGALPKERKIFLYSAHEYNVATMLRILNVYYPHVPPFGATLIFEIHMLKETYGIKLLYHNYSSEEPQLMQIPECDDICPIHKFYKLVENYLPQKSDHCSFNFEL